MFNDGKCFIVKKTESEGECISCGKSVDISIGYEPLSEDICSNPLTQDQVKEKLVLKLMNLPEKINKYAHHIFSVLAKGKEIASSDLISYRQKICKANEGICYINHRCVICDCPVNLANPLRTRNKAGWEDEECPRDLW